MKAEEISSKEYSSIFNNTYNIFLSVPFNELNKAKCEQLVYLLFHEGRVKLGTIAGIKEDTFCSPFSAPYGGFSTYSDKVNLKYIDEALKILDKYLESKKIKQSQFILPPNFYNERFLPKVFYSLIQNGYQVKYTDLNYHMNTADFKHYQTGLVDKRTIEKLKKAFSVGLSFKQVFNENDQSFAYNIVKDNRKAKGRPIYLTFKDLLETGKIINADFFLVYQQEVPIASSVVYHVAQKIVQAIFWADVAEYSLNRPMNFLVYKLLEFYANQGMNIIDLGISTENGLPNYGLCDFKENTGSRASLKYTLTKSIQ
jgi:hypothetical protein